jgi:predicted RNA binding protein YcfA (HicA-like mRNA interferase family)
MPPVPLLRPKEVIYAFEKLGWETVRQKGSHIIMTKPGQIAPYQYQNMTSLLAEHFGI